ncbi:MAG: ABC transporter permease subunit [Duodenibacillus sp.]|nr:ABC transporter permease subunit [Duodenibacillus sp.]
MSNLALIFRMDVESAVRSKWYWAYVLIVLTSIGSIFAAGVADSRVMGFTGLTRTLLIFIQACNLILPIVILVSTVRTLVKEKETNVFEYLLSYPISLGEYYWGKALSRLVIVAMPLIFGMAFAVAFSLIKTKAVPWELIGLYTALLVANTVYFVGLSFLLSSVVKTQEMGLGLALAIWLVVIALIDVVLLGMMIKALVPEEVIYAIALVNPIQVFKMAAVSLFDPVLSVIGPAAYFILDLFGNRAFIVYSLCYLIASGLGFFAVGFWRFCRKDLL